MTNMTLSVPEDLKIIMDKHKTVKWSEVGRQAIWDYANKLEIMDNLASKSKLTEAEAIEMGRKIKRGIAKRHGL